LTLGALSSAYSKYKAQSTKYKVQLQLPTDS